MDGSCHFINGNKRAAVALASFPGSGNTWVRQLLEKATGICTGMSSVVDCIYQEWEGTTTPDRVLPRLKTKAERVGMVWVKFVSTSNISDEKTSIG